ncbi:MAG TPA: hypothetical protein VGU71_01135 [Candidatus Dormibacteraeota bacterium]|nr:hypothetical protein [Candidatus Dormibacteraeota bacterium]
MPPEYVDLPIYRDGLASALGFTPSDLDSNRAGRISASQRASLLRNLAVRVGTTLVCLLGAVGSAGVAWSIGASSDHGPKYQAAIVQSLVIAAVLVFAAGVSAWSCRKQWKDVMEGLVSSVEDVVEPTGQPIQVRRAWALERSVFWRYFWMVGDQRFAVSPKAYIAVTKARHRLYFLPRTRRLLAAEPISTVAKSMS